MQGVVDSEGANNEIDVSVWWQQTACIKRAFLLLPFMKICVKVLCHPETNVVPSIFHRSLLIARCLLFLTNALLSYFNTYLQLGEIMCFSRLLTWSFSELDTAFLDCHTLRIVTIFETNFLTASSRRRSSPSSSTSLTKSQSQSHRHSSLKSQKIAKMMFVYSKFEMI